MVQLLAGFEDHFAVANAVHAAEDERANIEGSPPSLRLNLAVAAVLQARPLAARLLPRFCQLRQSILNYTDVCLFPDAT